MTVSDCLKNIKKRCTVCIFKGKDLVYCKTNLNKLISKFADCKVIKSVYYEESDAFYITIE